MSQRIRTLLLAALAAAALVLGLAGTASAHVTVSTSTSQGGGYAVLTFKVPVESATAHTVGLTVNLPTATPFTSVLAAPVPGWTAKLVESKLPVPLKDDDGNAVDSAVTQVTWTATDGGLAPGQFGEFLLSVGPLPTSGTLFLPAVQRYSDGTTVDWVQQAQGGAEPAHPAPSVVITPVSTSASASASAGTGSATGSGTGTGGRWGIGLGITAIVLALLAGGLAGAALTRLRGRPVAPTAPAGAATQEQEQEQEPEADPEPTAADLTRASS